MKHIYWHLCTFFTCLTAFSLTSCLEDTESLQDSSQQDGNKITIPAPDNVAAPPTSARRTREGVHFTVLKKPTSSRQLQALDKLSIEYTGWNTKGEMFDSSVTRGKPFILPLKSTQVIQGWQIILKQMKLGEKRRVWIPANLAYGENARNPKTAGMLVFDMEIVDVDPTPKLPATPTSLTPPADAVQYPSGLSSKILIKSTENGPSPKADQYALVHLNLWDSKGTLYDSSRSHKREISIPLKYTIKGLREGLMLMQVGDTYRFWIPQKLAYGDNPPYASPKGDLIYDIELLEIRDAGPLHTNRLKILNSIKKKAN